jgi:hypothetical protein
MPARVVEGDDEGHGVAYLEMDVSPSRMIVIGCRGGRKGEINILYRSADASKMSSQTPGEREMCGEREIFALGLGRGVLL